MCRFVAYLGKKAVILEEVLDKPENSLINQSRRAREGSFGLNGDGFGIGWYDHSIDEIPGLFKSVQPAWNDSNLEYLKSKIKSTCFIGHVRASTVGGVNRFNCHPFHSGKDLFVHNGTIKGFDKIKRPLLNLLDNEFFDGIQGQTDSECFFNLMLNIQRNEFSLGTLEDRLRAFQKAVKQVYQLQEEVKMPLFSRLNSAWTNGKELLATRYVSHGEPSLALYYSLGDYIDVEDSEGIMHAPSQTPGAIIVASEPLTDYTKEWHEVPENHALLVSSSLEVQLRPL